MGPKIIDLRHNSRTPRQAGRGSSTPASRTPPKRHEPLRKRRQRIRIYVTIACIILLALATYGLHWASYRPAMRIQEISVRGASLQDPQEVIDFVRRGLAQESWQFFPRDSIFFYPKDELRAAVVDAFPRLKSVRMGKAEMFGGHLIVNVDERTPYAVWCMEAAGVTGECYVFDDTGFIYARASSTPELPKVAHVYAGGVVGDPIGATFLPGQLETLSVFLKTLETEGFRPLRVRVESDRDFAVVLQNGFTIKASFGQDPHTLIHNLQLVAVSPALRGKEAQLEYIDLRFGNRVYYKFKNQIIPELQQ